MQGKKKKKKGGGVGWGDSMQTGRKIQQQSYMLQN